MFAKMAITTNTTSATTPTPSPNPSWTTGCRGNAGSCRLGRRKVADLQRLPLPTAWPMRAISSARLSRMVRLTHDVLASLERKGNAELSATADFIAGKFEFEHGNIAQSRQYFESALRFQPDNSTILIYYSAVLVRTGNASPGVPYAQRAALRPQFARRLHHARLRPVRLGPHQRCRCFLEAFA